MKLKLTMHKPKEKFLYLKKVIKIQLEDIKGVFSGRIPPLRMIGVPEVLIDIGFWKRAVRYQLIYSMSGLVVGLACVIGGIVLFLHGVTGSITWIAEFLKLKSKVTDAAPGAILFIVGLFVVWVTRFGIKIEK